VDDLYYLEKHSRMLKSFSFLGLGVMVVFAALGVVGLFESRQYRLLLLGGLLLAVLAANLIIFIRTYNQKEGQPQESFI
jgi:NADH:ubiquinone oxidoreductase subunit K